LVRFPAGFCKEALWESTSVSTRSYFIPPAYEDGTDRVFRNVDIYNSDAGELPKRKHNIFRTRRKFEIKRSSFIGINP